MTSKPKKQRSLPSPWHVAASSAGVSPQGKSHGISGRSSGWNGVPYLHTSPQRECIYGTWMYMVYGVLCDALCKYDLDAIWTSNYWTSWMFHHYNRDVAHGPPRPDACLGLHASLIVSVLNIYYLSIVAAGFPFIYIYIMYNLCQYV